MDAIKLQNYEVNNEEQRTCEYQGVTYFVMADIKNGKCFIEVDGERRYPFTWVLFLYTIP